MRGGAKGAKRPLRVRAMEGSGDALFLYGQEQPLNEEATGPY
jgi:hypothetical protein